ncbi:flavoprotein [Lapidilactobacillus luobeiensis]|uniref:flavoprotein n=1 Tax=Lapidilactobacillus luobeiensis TaxID=2950371 RepID=UPI0021C2EA0B|nr:flavoprotein [Lapidilactobacillus luobeiensis]
MNDFYHNGKLLLGITAGAYALQAAATIHAIQENICQNIKLITTPKSEHFFDKKALLALVELADDQELEQDLDPVDLTKWADLMVIIPASANTITKAANAITDNALLASIATAKCPLIFYPEMAITLWEQRPLQANIRKLQERGVYFSYAIDKQVTLANRTVTEPSVHPDLTTLKTDINSVLRKRTEQ